MPGGYCASACEACPADGACVETATGAHCLARCSRDADCRADEGYACDPMWHACAIPNTTALVPRACPLPPGVPARDPAFGPVAPGGELATGKGLPDPADCDEGHACGTPVVATAGARVVVVYAAGGGVRVRTSRDGGATFAPPSTPVVGNYGDVAVGRAIHVVSLVGSAYGAYGSADHRIDYVTSVDGGATFSPPQTISGREDSIPFYLANPVIAVDDRRGLVYVAYARGHRGGVWDVVIAVGKRVGTQLAWTRTRIGDDCAIHLLPTLAVDPATGTLHVAWYDSRGEHGRFAHATCGPGATACKQRGAISEPFTVPLSTERAGPRWLGERAQLAVDPAKKKIHATWLEQDGGAAHPMHADGAL